MNRSLMALVATSLLTSACASSDTTDDELAGETTADEALDGKADSASDGVYTYFEVWKDLRACSSPTCGGYFFHRLNRSTTTCHNGTSAWSCYVPELDWTQSELPAELQTVSRFDAAIFTDATNPDGAAALLAALTSPAAAKAYADGGLVSRVTSR